MRKFFIFLGVLVLLLAVAVGVLLWALKDANRFKPQLEALVADTTGMQIKFNGDLNWQLWPPVVLAGEDIAFTDDGDRYQIGRVGVRADVLALLRGSGLVVQELRASDVDITDTKLGDIIRLASVQVENFEAGKPAAFQARGELIAADGASTPVAADGAMTYYPEQDSLTLSGLAFEYDTFTGTCEAKVSQLSRKPKIKYNEGKDDLLPLDTFRGMDWVADCQVPGWQSPDVAELQVRDVAIHSENTNARSKTTIKVPQMFGGQLLADVAIDTRRRTPQWRVTTDAKELQAQEVARLLSPSLSWVAPLLADGEYQLSGNTSDALLSSVKGSMAIDANTGVIDITRIKEMVLGLAQLAGEGERVQNWQDQLAYEQFKGNWQVDGKTHSLNFGLDNLLITANGDYSVVSDALDMRGALQINEHPTLNALDINPELFGLAIPIRCRGTATEPACGLDTDRVQQALTQHAANKAKGKLGEELDSVIEDKVPEEYRDTAREALKGLGDLLKKRD